MSRAVDIKHSSYYIHGFDMKERICAVLYLSVTALTHCYKTAFLHSYLQFFPLSFKAISYCTVLAL